MKFFNTEITQEVLDGKAGKVIKVFVPENRNVKCNPFSKRVSVYVIEKRRGLFYLSSKGNGWTKSSGNQKNFYKAVKLGHYRRVKEMAEIEMKTYYFVLGDYHNVISPCRKYCVDYYFEENGTLFFKMNERNHYSDASVEDMEELVKKNQAIKMPKAEAALRFGIL